MNIKKTVRTKIIKTANKELQNFLRSTHELSSTIQIPLVSELDDIALKSYSHIEVECPGLQTSNIELGRTEITIGRDKECSLCLPLTNVSRKHARIVSKDEDFLVEDLNSTNGTFVNGVKVSRCVLRNNDQIRIGEARIRFTQQKFKA